MSQPVVRSRSKSQLRRGVLGLVFLLIPAGWLLLPAASQTPADAQLVKGANFKQAYKYSSEFLKQFVYSNSVTANWIGSSDMFWYQFNTSKGKQWYRVNAREGTKEPLFDRVKLGAQLSELVRKPLDPQRLPLTQVSLSDEATKLWFAAEGMQFEYAMRTEKLTKTGKAAPPPTGPGGLDADQIQKIKDVLGEQRFSDFIERQERIASGDMGDLNSSLEEDFADLDMYLHDILPLWGKQQANDVIDDEPAQQKKGKGGQKDGGKGGGQKGGKGGAGGDAKLYSPDKKFYVFAMDNNLYFAEEGKDDEPLQLTTDSAEQYTFNVGGGKGGGGGGTGIGGAVKDQKDGEKDKGKKVRPNVTWAKDSKTFYATRVDTRGIQELFLINSLSNPRPTLSRYTYPMPGDEKIRKTEMFAFSTAKKKLNRIEAKWKDENYGDLHWGKAPNELRFIRSDRLHRNAEFCTVNLQTGECKCLILEGFENASLVTSPMRYLDESDEMIWWSAQQLGPFLPLRPLRQTQERHY